jgi:hypothetical protein
MESLTTYFDRLSLPLDAHVKLQRTLIATFSIDHIHSSSWTHRLLSLFYSCFGTGVLGARLLTRAKRLRG